MVDVAGVIVVQLAGQIEVGAHQTLADAGDQLLERIGVVAELLAELAVEALRRARIMDIFVRERAGVMIVRAKRAALR